MRNFPNLAKLETLIVRDPYFLFTLVSYFLVLIIYVNLSTFQSPFLGSVASILYISINGIFLGHVFFDKETVFFRLALGILLFILLLGFVGWLAVIIYNLDVMKFTLVLFVAATFSSVLEKKMRNKNAA